MVLENKFSIEAGYQSKIAIIRGVEEEIKGEEI
jgi:hypothetical protein